MTIGLVLVIVALVLALLDVILWNAVGTYNRVLLTPVAVILLCISLLLGSGAIH